MSLPFVGFAKCEGDLSLTELDDVTTSGSVFTYSIDWNPKSDYVAVGGTHTDKELIIYSFDGSSFTEVETVDIASNYGYSVSWHPDGDYLAISDYPGQTARIYSWNGSDTLTEVETVSFSYHVRSVHWHPDGNYLAIGHNSGGSDEIAIYSWNGSDTLTSVETIDLSDDCNAVRWSNNGDYLAAFTRVSSNEIRVYSWNGSDTLTLQDTYSPGDRGASIAWLVNDDYLFCGGENSTKTVVGLGFDGSTLTEKDTISFGANMRATVATSNGGNYVYTCQYISGSATTNYWIKVYQWDYTNEEFNLVDQISENIEGYIGLGVSRHNNYFASGGSDKSLSIIKSFSTDLRNSRNIHCNEIPSLSDVEQINSSGDAWPAKFHPNNNYIAVGGNMTSKQLIVYSWNGSDTLTEVETVNLGHNCYGIDWHQDGDYLAATEYNDSTNSIHVYSWNGSDTLTEVETISVTNGCGGCHWHPSGDYLAVGTYNTSGGIKVYSWNGSDTLTEVESINNSNAAYSVRWSPDGDYLAVGSGRSSNQLAVFSWNGSDTLTEQDTYNTGGGGCYDPRWSSDSSYIFASNGSGGTAKIWFWAWSGSAITLKDSIASASWSSRGLDIYDDKYLAVGRDWGSAASQAVVGLYRIMWGAEELTLVDELTINARSVDIPGFGIKGKYIALSMLDDSSSYTVRMAKMY